MQCCTALHSSAWSLLAAATSRVICRLISNFFYRKSISLLYQSAHVTKQTRRIESSAATSNACRLGGRTGEGKSKASPCMCPWTERRTTFYEGKASLCSFLFVPELDGWGRPWRMVHGRGREDSEAAAISAWCVQQNGTQCQPTGRLSYCKQLGACVCLYRVRVNICSSFERRPIEHRKATPTWHRVWMIDAYYYYSVELVEETRLRQTCEWISCRADGGGFPSPSLAPTLAASMLPNCLLLELAAHALVLSPVTRVGFFNTSHTRQHCVA